MLTPVSVKVPAPNLVKEAAEEPSEITPVIEPVPELLIETAPLDLMSAAVKSAVTAVKLSIAVFPPIAPTYVVSPPVVVASV